MQNKLFFAVAAAILTASTISKADKATEALPLVVPKTRTVAAFKNGLAFVFKSGQTPLKDGWTRMDQLPPAALGCLWIGTTSKTEPVSEVIAYKEKTSVEADSVDMAELLAANVGQHVIITYLAGSSQRIAEGDLMAVPTRKPEAEESAPENPNGSPYQSRWPVPPPPFSAPEIVLLRGTKAGGSELVTTALNISLIQSVELSGAAHLHTQLEREVARTKVHVAGEPAQAEITVACLEKGIVWSPSYRINLADDHSAVVELDAVLADDQEDLDHADVSFVVGYPNFLFANLLTPMSLQQSVAAFVQALTSEGNGRNVAGRFQNNLMSQAVAYNAPGGFDAGALSAGYAVSAATPGEQNEDLYFYRKTGVTLKKGDRARFSLLSTRAPYEHLYEWEVGDTMNLDARGFHRGDNPEPENLVWHVLSLTNAAPQPWTTAPAFTVNDTLPVAQDTLSYTPPGGHTTLKLTVSTEVKAEQSQNETARHQLNLDGRSYDEVTVEGKLRLTSLKKEEISMRVSKSLVGEVLSAPDGKISKGGRNLTAVNSSSEIAWEFKLPAGQIKELTYQYKVLLVR